ncbi:MAG: GNAT family N-acetyltransferase [Actinomycetota bacterium]
MGVSLAAQMLERPELVAIAPAVGPFPQVPFLSAWWEVFGSDWKPLIVDWAEGWMPLMELDGRVEFMGGSDLTDYHSPLSINGAAEGLSGAIQRLLSEVGHGSRVTFDSLPFEAAAPLEPAMRANGLSPVIDEHAQAMVLDLPEEAGEFYRRLTKKERHELRRKRRRYEEQVGPVVLTSLTGTGRGFEQFVRLHRMANGTKGDFLTECRVRFFAQLAALPGWRVDLLETAVGASACLFGWSDGTDYYLYNSSYDSAFHASAPGLVLLVAMIEKGIEEGWRRFDFLKGEEPYKARLGAHPRPLYRIVADT